MFPAIRMASHRLSARLTLTFGALVLATAVVTGAPAYGIIRAQLEHQTWERISAGGQISQTLVASEQRKLQDLTILIAQRPTLQELLDQDDLVPLPEYLRSLQISMHLDSLSVYNPDGHRLALAGTEICQTPGPADAGAGFYRLAGAEPGLALAAVQPVLHASTGARLGYVNACLLINDGFARQMAEESDLEYVFVVGGRRIAASTADLTTVRQRSPVVQDDLTGQFTRITTASARYYSVDILLGDTDDPSGPFVEVSLPIDSLARTENRALVSLIVSTLLIALIGAGLGTFQARRLTAPLNTLIEATHNISAGDLETPIPTPDHPVEITALAAALEEGRANTYGALSRLSQANAWSETLIGSIVEGIVAFDEHNCIEFFSQGAERITAWPHEEAIGCPLDTVFPLEESSGLFSEQLPKPGGKQQIAVLNRNGKSITLAITGARLVPPNRNDVQTAIVLRDITEEQAIQHLRSYFLGNISHEFRTPLSALKASVELLLQDFDTLPVSELRELLNSLNRSVTGLQTLIDNLLESTRIEAGRFRIHRYPTNIKVVVDEAVNFITPLMDRRQQTLCLRCPPSFPSIDADPTRLTQVVVNLLSNASKYSPVGAAIDLGIDLVDDQALRVTIADEGPGIPSSNKASLFQRFVRLATGDGRQYGVGLGLWVVKVIVEEHGGEVGVEDCPGGGALFWFSLPITKGAIR